MSSGLESPASELNKDMSGKEHTDEIFNKHQRFNLRKVNLPPLRKDHSRSVETGLVNKQQNRGFSSATAAALKINKECEINEEKQSPLPSVKSGLEEDDEDSNKQSGPATPSLDSYQNVQDMSQSLKE